jgi:hypothetical protein
LDQGVITLPSVDRRVLRTPAERVESMREIMRLVRDTKCNQHDGANPAGRPSVRVKAGLQQVLPRLWGETGRAPRYAALFQTAKVALGLSQLLPPSADRRAADADLARHGRLGEVAGLQQPTGFQAAFFKL